MCNTRWPSRCRFHRDQTESYRAAREADLAVMEYETRLFPGDVRLWLESHQLITFKAWLIGSRQTVDRV